MMFWLVIANSSVLLLITLLTLLGFKLGKGDRVRWLRWATAVLLLLMQAGCWIAATGMGSGLQ